MFICYSQRLADTQKLVNSFGKYLDGSYFINGLGLDKPGLVLSYLLSPINLMSPITLMSFIGLKQLGGWDVGVGQG